MRDRPSLPKRVSQHSTAASALQAFGEAVENAGRFVLQGADDEDYGVDQTIEVIDKSDDWPAPMR